MTLGTPAGASIAVENGSHSISAPIVLAGSLTVSTTGGASLVLSGSVSELTPGTNLNLSGEGQLVLAGAGNYTGGTTVYGGTVYVTSSTALPDDRGLVIGAGGTFVFDPTEPGTMYSWSAAAAMSQGSPASRTVAVPEPGTLVLLLAALWSAGACRRFSKRRDFRSCSVSRR